MAPLQFHPLMKIQSLSLQKSNVHGMSSAEFAMLFCLPMPFETIYPFFPLLLAPPQPDPTAYRCNYYFVTHNRNCPFSHLVVIFRSDICIWTCSQKMFPLESPLWDSDCSHFNCIVYCIVSWCLDKTLAICKFRYSCWNFPKLGALQCIKKGWEAQLNDISTRFKDCQTLFLSSLTVP